MSNVYFFGRSIETEDQEVIALDYCLRGNHSSKRDIQKKFAFKDRQISKILAARAYFQRIEKAANDKPTSVVVGYNSIMDKIIYSLYGETTGITGIIVSCDKNGNFYVTQLKKEDKPKPTTSKRGGGNCVVNDDIIIDVFKLRSENVTISKIAEKYGISQTTCHRVLGNFYIKRFPEAYKKVDEMLANKTPAEPSTATYLQPQKQSADELIPIADEPTTIRCGLIDERHPMPVDLYVFNTFTQADLFDYPKMEERSKMFIDEHISFDDDGNPKQSITCYVTGLQCALASFIKVCNEMHVNLALMHYNVSKCIYEKQIIWDSFNASLNCHSILLEKPLRDSKKFTYKISLQELIKLDTIYRVMITTFNSKDNREHEVWLCKDISSATEAFNKALALSIISPNHMGIYLDRWDKQSYQFYKTKTLLKSQNY